MEGMRNQFCCWVDCTQHISRSVVHFSIHQALGFRFIQATWLYRLRMEHPPRAHLKCGAADGRRTWIGVIPRGSTVLVTEGHISLTAVSAFEVGFPPATCIADGQRHRMEEMGTASRVGHALVHLRDDTTVSYMGCTWLLGTSTNASF